MKYKNLKKINRACSVNIQQSKGFVLLFAVVLSSIVLTITLGVLNISLKEINFSTSAKDTNESFFAADTGAECALFYDKSVEAENAFTGTATIMECNNNTITPIESPLSFWSFTITDLNKDGKGCAIVTVDKTNPITTKIISKGYNLGGDGTCSSTNSNKVERQLELSY